MTPAFLEAQQETETGKEEGDQEKGQKEEAETFCLALGPNGERKLSHDGYQQELARRTSFGLFVDFVERTKPKKQERCRAGGIGLDGEFVQFDLNPEYARILVCIARQGGDVPEGNLDFAVQHKKNQLRNITSYIKRYLEVDVLKIRTSDGVLLAQFIPPLSNGFLFLLPG